MTAYLLHTKLCLPPPRPDAVARPHLIERLNQGLHTGRKLILLSAPAGFGKTTLLVEWLRRANPDSAWFSLDKGDNDPVRFLRYLVAALQDVNPEIGQEAQAMLQAPQPPPAEAVLASLLNDVTAIGHPINLVLDDYHLIQALPIHEMLTFALDHLPAGMRLILSTRQDPPLALPRLRARAQIVELRQADLQFTALETTSFLRGTMHLDLDQNDIAALQRRTEGWIAGLQLAALSLQNSADPSQQVHALTGSHRYILDYLIEEVFDRQPLDVQQFLLQTSILERLTAPLCDALTGRSDGHETLVALERSNLFVHSLDVSRQWYRYHRLFAELLRHRLQNERGDGVAVLYQKASDWYAENGYPADAVRYAIEAKDWERAAELLLGITSELLNRGEIATLVEWYQALPQTVLRSRPRLCHEYSWLLILTDQVEAAQEYLALVKASAQGDRRLMGQLAVAHAYIARLRGDGQRVIELSQQALSLLPEKDVSSRAVAAVNVGLSQWYLGHLDGAEQTLAEARQAATQAGNDYVRITAHVFATRLVSARGKLKRAAETYRQLIQANPLLPTVALARVDLAKLLIEWNDLSAAVDQAGRGLEQSTRNADTEVQFAALSVLLYIQQLRGQVEAAETLQEQHTRLMQHPGLSPFARWHALGYRTLAALAAADLDQAAGWLDQAPPLDRLPPGPERLLLALCRARLLLAQNKTEQAYPILATRLAIGTRGGFAASLVETHAMQALCAPDEQKATDHLSQALRLGARSRHVRAFLDLGQPMAERLRWAARQGIEVKYTRTLLAAFRAPKAAGLAPQAVSSPPTSPRLVEPLSEREADVLRYLVQGHTYQEISQALYLSLNTVKTHLKRVYAKLDVHTRRQAIAKAQELGIV